MAVLLTRANLPRAATLLAALLATGLLNGCLRDACNNECTTGTVCDEALAACVPEDDGGQLLCAQDGDCPVGRARCNAGGLCVQCLTSSDCPGGQTCNSRTNTCLTGCTGPSDCANVTGRHQCSLAGECVECTSSVHCPAVDGAHRTCDQGTNVCVLNPCHVDGDCAEDPSGYRYCEAGACVECHGSGDCVVPGRPFCTTETHLCAQCLQDGDCNVVNGESCVANVCEKTGCGTDGDCPADLHCDTSNHACVPCLEDAHCNFGGVCQNRHCGSPASCHADAECLYGTYCANGVCAACRTNADCASGQTCRQDGTCQQPSSCTRSDVCGAGQACLEGSCQLIVCVADSYEANNFPQDATPLPTMATIALNASYCPNEPDYYVVAVPAGQGLQVKVRPTYQGDSTTSSIALDLIPGPGLTSQAVHGQLMRDGSIVATLERMPTGGRVALIRITGNVDTGTPYALSATINPAGICGNDVREPDDGQTQSTLVMPGTFQGTLCPEDLDWYAVDVPANERPVATLTSNGGAAEVGLAFYTLVNGMVMRDNYSFSDATGAVNVTASMVAPAGGQRFWVDVIEAAQRQSQYTLHIALVANPPPNDTCANATVLPPNATMTGTTAGAASDEVASCGGTGGDAFWQLTVTELSKVEIHLASSFNAVLSLEGACGGTTELACTGGASQSPQLDFEALPAGTYRIRVAGANAANFGAYTISTTVSRAATPTNASCNRPIDLAFTAGEAQVTGTVAGVDDGLPGCGRTGGEAVYAFTLEDPAKLDVTLAGFAGASLTLAEVSDCATLTAAQCLAANAEGGASLSINAVPAGQYVLIVDGGTAVSGTYAMTVRTSTAIFPPDNDTCGSAIELASGTISESGDTRAAADDFAPVCAGTGAGGDAVYHLAVSTPQQVSLQLAADFDAALALSSGTCGAGTPVDCELGSAALVRQILPVGDYYLWVDGYAGATGLYTLSGTIQDAPPVPTNQSCATATAVSAGTVSGSTATADPALALKPSNCRSSGSSHPLPLDGPNVVYAVTIPAGKTLSATLRPSDFDGALFVVDSCSASTCVAASDSSYEVGVAESVTVPNGGTSDRSVFLVVGSWHASAWGSFTLDVQVN